MSDYVITVTIWVQPGREADFLEATRDNIANTRQEPGNVQFDCAQAEDEPNRFHFYERYVSKDAFAAHQQTPHYFRWREKIDGIMAQRREGRRWALVVS